MIDAERFRALALALEGTSEAPHFDRIAFRRARIFATLAPGGVSANLRFTPADQELYCTARPDAWAPVDNAWGRQGWTTAALGALDEADLRGALLAAWREAGGRAGRPKRA